MKKLIITAMLPLFALASIAQQTDLSKFKYAKYAQKSMTDTVLFLYDTTALKHSRIELGRYTAFVFELNEKEKSELKAKKDSTDRKDDLTHFAGLDVGVNMLVNGSGSNTFNGNEDWLNLNTIRSMSFRWNFAEHKIRLYKDYVGLTTGMAFAWNSYTPSGNYLIQRNADSTFATIDSTLTYSKNKLRATYFQVPLLLEFNTSEDPKKSFHVSAGVVGGLRISGRYHRTFENNGDQQKVKLRNDYYMNTFTADAMVRIGFSNLCFWGTYSLQPLFREGKGPEVYPVSFGVSLLV